MLTSELPLISKFMLTIFVLSQKFLHRFDMWTLTDYKEGSNEILHVMKIKQFGITYMRSKKTFWLEPDGKSLKVEGVEYHWPKTKKSVLFQPLTGEVNDEATRANYQMPFMGISCTCRTVLEPPLGEIYISTPWLQGQFSMTKESKEHFEENFKQAN